MKGTLGGLMPRSTSQNFCCQCPCPQSESQLHPTSAGNRATLTASSPAESNVWWRSVITGLGWTVGGHRSRQRSRPQLLNRSRVEDRLLVLQPGVRAVPMRWESQVQYTGPQETSQLHVISNGENLPEISVITPRPSSTQ